MKDIHIWLTPLFIGENKNIPVALMLYSVAKDAAAHRRRRLCLEIHIYLYFQEPVVFKNFTPFITKSILSTGHFDKKVLSEK